MAIKLNSQEQKDAVVSVLSLNDNVVDLLAVAAQKLKSLDYQGEAREALFSNMAKFEKEVNKNAENFNQIEAAVNQNIEISEDMKRALHQHDRVTATAVEETIKARTDINPKKLAGMRR